MTNNTNLFIPITAYIEGLDISTVSEARKEAMQPLVEFIKQKAANNQPILLNFICTHNSRRSHLTQVWAQTMAAYYNISQVVCYSGGNEVTALFPMAAQVLEKTGFEIAKLSETDNPVYSIKFAGNIHPIIAFSKTYNDAFNPKSGFAAVLTCSDADGACPFVGEAEIRVPVTYDDPKLSDGTPQQEKTYLERSRQIATEMKYLFSAINS